MIIQGSRIKGRLIFIGDIHGCYSEMLELLDLIKPEANDIVISLGDFLDRGPDSGKCIEYWLEKKYLALLGNHDERIINWAEGKKVAEGEDLDSSINLVGKKEKLVAYLKKLPYFIFFPDVKIFAVHAAIDINRSLIDQIENPNKDIFIRGRYVRESNENSFNYIQTGNHLDTDCFWWQKWNGTDLLIFGHTPQITGLPLIRSNAICIDTACVYGMTLTAAIFERTKGWSFLSVNAKSQYWKIAKKNEIIYL